jgi:CRISPR-associated protein Csb3
MSDPTLIPSRDVARLLRVATSDAAGNTLRRWGLRPTGREAGRGGESLWSLAEVRKAIEGRVGRGYRSDLTYDAERGLAIADPMAPNLATHSLLVHLAFFGLAAICEAGGARLRMTWRDANYLSDGPPAGRLRPHLLGIDAASAATAVHGHACALAEGRDPGCLLQGATMTPRPPRPTSQQEHRRIQHARETVLDRLTAAPLLATWAQAMCMTEVSWQTARKPDGESSGGQFCYTNDNDGHPAHIFRRIVRHPLDTQPANSGAELLSKMRRLARDIAGLPVSALAASLTGVAAHQAKTPAHTIPGLAGDGATADSVLLWCALWAGAWLPRAYHWPPDLQLPHFTFAAWIGGLHDGRFAFPVWETLWTPAKVRTTLASAQLTTAATTHQEAPDDDAQRLAARAWLGARDISGLMSFPIRNIGTERAARRVAYTGQPLSLHN